jgi:hypothetical protein
MLNLSKASSAARAAATRLGQAVFVAVVATTGFVVTVEIAWTVGLVFFRIASAVCGCGG